VIEGMAARRYEALDGWRGICALAVALNHLWFVGHFRTMWAVNNFHLFVDYFFVLSGFVISVAYSGKLDRWSGVLPYMVRRLGRIYPLHLVTLGVFILYQAAQVLFLHRPAAEAFGGHQSLGNLLVNLLMLQGMGVSPSGSWNGPSWSISVEFFLYLTFAVAFLATRRVAFPLVALVLSALGALALRLYAPEIMDSTYDYGFARGLYGFFLGCIVYRLLLNRPAARMRFGTALEIGMLGVVAIFLSIVDRGYWSMLSTPIFAVAVWLFAQEPGAVSAALRSRMGRAMGKWSFSIYLWHYVILYILFGALKFVQPHIGKTLIVTVKRVTDGASFTGADFGSPWANDLAALLFLAVVIVIASISYPLIEKPGMRLSKRIADRIEQGRARRRPADIDVSTPETKAEPA
jgi:peptidoglycan/LPS O-acetylase OafA/YrhL